MTDDFDREERAFRDALHAAADAEGFRALDPDALRPASRPVSRLSWSSWAAAAVVVVVVGVLAVVALPFLRGMSGASTASAPEAPAGGAAESDSGGAEPATAAAAPSQESTRESFDSAGQQQVTYGNVSVLVPATWVSRELPPWANCALADPPAEPFFSVWPAQFPDPVPCPAQAPEVNLVDVPYLVFSPSDAEVWFPSQPGWSTRERTVGDVRVSVYTNDTAMAGEILATVQVT